MTKKHILAVLICTPIITHSMQNDDPSQQQTTLERFHAARAATGITLPVQASTSTQQTTAPRALPDHRAEVRRVLTEDETSGNPQFVAHVAHKGSVAFVNYGNCPTTLREAFNLPDNASNESVTAKLVELRTRYESQPEVLKGFELLASFNGLTPEQRARQSQ